MLEHEESYGQICPSSGIIPFENCNMKFEKHFRKESQDDEKE